MSICELVKTCQNLALIGNGFCNDETNNADCEFDGGDCSPWIKLIYECVHKKS